MENAVVILQLTRGETLGLIEALDTLALETGELTDEELSVYSKVTEALSDLGGKDGD